MAWSKEKLPARLLMVCVLGDQTSMPVARSFAQGLDLKEVDVGFINSRKNMPNWGQLGCSGYIIHDGKGEIASKATKGFNQYGADKAFRDVERVVFTLLGKEVPKKCLALSRLEKMSNAGRDVEDKPVLTGVEAMDDDHERCHAVLEALQKAPSVALLQEFVALVREHFAAEEAWFQETNWGGYDQFARGVKTVPCASHVGAHRGILAMLDQTLAAAQLSGKVTEDEADELNEIFLEHTNVYDAAYAVKDASTACSTPSTGGCGPTS